MSTSMTVTTYAMDTTLEQAVGQAYAEARTSVLEGFRVDGVTICVSLVRTIASLEPVAFEVELDIDARKVES